MNNPSKQASFSEALKAWAMIGLQSFGGPAAQIALMHRVLVDEKKWLTEAQYLSALSFCMLLPGPEAMQLATYSGWRLHGVRGGVAAGLLFVLPGALVMLALASIYVFFGDISIIRVLFYGVQAAVLVIVLDALLKISKRALNSPVHWWLAGLSFVGLFFLHLPFPLIVLGTGLIGLLMPAKAAMETTVALPEKGILQLIKTVVTWGAIWIAPFILISTFLPDDHIFNGLYLFFSKLAVVTFGGAYAVLAYMAQDVVADKGWLFAHQMVDGLGLAETTPGPLILVTEFVGFVAAFQWNDAQNWLMGLGGALITLWVTFIPCFLWIFAGAPYLEWVSTRPRLSNALTAITASVVGVILNLSLWFAIQVLFTQHTVGTLGPMEWRQPIFSSLNENILLVTVISGFLLLVMRWNLLMVLLLAMITSLLIWTIGP
jgi:chromate transporter